MLVGGGGQTAFLIPPIPNTLFQRDPSCWIYRRRHLQSDVLAGAAGRRRCCSGPSTSFIRSSRAATSRIWFGDSDEDFAAATLEGGDVMPIGKGIVLIGMGERTHPPGGHPGRA